MVLGHGMLYYDHEKLYNSKGDLIGYKFAYGHTGGL